MDRVQSIQTPILRLSILGVGIMKVRISKNVNHIISNLILSQHAVS
jgi:hypothetical protein